jgi:hypothetical protein
VIFGGRGRRETNGSRHSCVFDDVRMFDLHKKHWLVPASRISDVGGEPQASARYGHLSAVSGDHLFIFGGQDINNAWVEDICVYDLVARRWTTCLSYPRRYSVYNSFAVAPMFVVPPQPAALASGPPDNSFTHLPYSVPASSDSPTGVYVYDVSPSKLSRGTSLRPCF